MRLAAAQMAKQEPDAQGQRGVIINVSSIAGLDGFMIAYGSSKAGVAALTYPAACELGKYGIRVLSIAPGIMETPMTAGIPPPDMMTLIQKVACFPKRMGLPYEFGKLCLSIIDNDFLNGEIIRLDGGGRCAKI